MQHLLEIYRHFEQLTSASGRPFQAEAAPRDASDVRVPVADNSLGFPNTNGDGLQKEPTNLSSAIPQASSSSSGGGFVLMPCTTVTDEVLAMSLSEGDRHSDAASDEAASGLELAHWLSPVHGLQVVREEHKSRRQEGRVHQ